MLHELGVGNVSYLKGLSEAEDFREANVDIKHVVFR
jgi:hypothetical protein